MALRALQGPTGGGTPVGGTGTTNTIPRWTGASTLGDSGLIDNGTAIYTTTRNVGIGTTSTSARLHSVAADGTYQFAASGTTRAVRFLTNATSANIEGVDPTLSASYQPLTIGGSTVTLANSGSPALTVNTSGNVGIGTASPSSYEASARQLVVGSGTGNQGITIAGNNNLNLYFATGTTGALPYRGFIRYDAADDSMWLATASTVRWKVTGTGHFIANADNTYDIGASGATRPRIVYVGTGVVGGYIRAGAASAGVASTTTIGNGTSTTATAGAQTLPANPLGFIIAHVGTTEVRIPYYAV